MNREDGEEGQDRPAATPLVLVGCDGSWESMEAVDVAVEEARWHAAPLVLVTVQDETGHGARTLGDWTRNTAAVADEARSIGERSLERVGGRVPDVTVLSVPSTAAAELREITCRATVLVLGRHGASGRVAFTSGSTSDQLTRLVRCPVLVTGSRGSSVREPVHLAAGHHRPAVVVGVDDSPAAEVVLSVAVREAQHRGWPLTVIHSLGHRAQEVHVEAAAIWARHGDLLLAGRSPDHSLARVVVEAGPPVGALLDHAESGDLLVVGTRGEGRLAGFTPGSVAHGVLEAMRCDVLVVPPAAVTVAVTAAVTAAGDPDRTQRPLAGAVTDGTSP